jgi:hypothetical protein
LSEKTERLAVRIVGLLVIVGFVSSFELWTIDTSLSSGESLFAIYLSIDLIAFTLITYIYRKIKAGENLGRIPLLAGCTLLAILVFLGFTV